MNKQKQHIVRFSPILLAVCKDESEWDNLQFMCNFIQTCTFNIYINIMIENIQFTHGKGTSFTLQAPGIIYKTQKDENLYCYFKK